MVLSKATRVPTRLRPSVVMMQTFSVWGGVVSLVVSGVRGGREGAYYWRSC